MYPGRSKKPILLSYDILKNRLNHQAFKFPYKLYLKTARIELNYRLTHAMALTATHANIAVSAF